MQTYNLLGVVALTVACANAGSGDGGFGPAEEEILAQIDGLPVPFSRLWQARREITATSPERRAFGPIS